MTHTAPAAPTIAELVALIATSTSFDLIASGWTTGHTADTFAVGDVVFAYSRGALRRAVIVKVGRKNATVRYTTRGAVDEAQCTVDAARERLATLPAIERRVRKQEARNLDFYAGELDPATRKYEHTTGEQRARYADAVAAGLDAVVASIMRDTVAGAERTIAAGVEAHVNTTDKAVAADAVFAAPGVVEARLAEREAERDAAVAEYVREVFETPRMPVAAAAPAEVVEVEAELVEAVEDALAPAGIVNREAWLAAAVDKLRPLFAELADVELPAAVRVSCGWPGGKSPHKTIGQCWYSAEDKVAQVFISPRLVDVVDVLGVLVHELVHAWDGGKSGHKAAFKRVAVALGLEGKMTATTVGETLRATLQSVAADLGEYPHSRLGLSVSGAGKTQTTRMLKVECPTDGYTVRMTRKWIDELGTPTCPCGEQMHEAGA